MCVFVQKGMKNVNELWDHHLTKVRDRGCWRKWASWQECGRVWFLGRKCVIPWWPAVWSDRFQRPSCSLCPLPSGLSGRGSWPGATVWCRSRGRGWSLGCGSAGCLDCWLSSAYSLEWDVEEDTKERWGKGEGKTKIQQAITDAELELKMFFLTRILYLSYYSNTSKSTRIRLYLNTSKSKQVNILRSNTTPTT